MKFICDCGGMYTLLSIIHDNNQVNFKCFNCGKYGFILNSQVYIETKFGTYDKVNED